MWSLAQRFYREPESFEGKISALLVEVKSLKTQILTCALVFQLFHGLAHNFFSNRVSQFCSQLHFKGLRITLGNRRV